MAGGGATTEGKTSRSRGGLVSVAKNPSTPLSREAGVAVKCNVLRGWRASHRRSFGRVRGRVGSRNIRLAAGLAGLLVCAPSTLDRRQLFGQFGNRAIDHAARKIVDRQSVNAVIRPCDACHRNAAGQSLEFP